MIQEHSKYNINLFDYCTCLEIGIKNVGSKIYLLDGQAQINGRTDCQTCLMDVMLVFWRNYLKGLNFVGT